MEIPGELGLGAKRIEIQPVCAVIVTYHPVRAMLDNVSKILSQVQGLVVVDNGSSPIELAPWKEASQTLKFELIENGENLGIAEALNQGVRWAQSQDYHWVLLFDQDSHITDGYVDKMFASWETHPDRARVASIHPNYRDPELGVEAVFRRAKDGGPVVAMTSGALMPTWIFDRIGMFMTEYFIDEVDTEYCYRIRAAGYLLADARDAVLLHHIGQPKRRTILGIQFTPTHHSALRRYYMSRNRLVLYMKYFPVFPGWVSQSMKDSMIETMKCFLGEENRGRKFRNFLLGTWDGLTGRMGKRSGL